MRRRLPAVGAAAAAVLLAAAGALVALSESSGSVDYRTASAADATVDQTMDVPGLATPVDQAVASFQVGGTVAEVDVTAGEAVSAGQPLATLETAALQQAVSADETALSGDRSKLSEDEAAEAGVSGQPTSSGNTTSANMTSGSEPSGATHPSTRATSGTSAATDALVKAQRAVVAAQRTVDASIRQEVTDVRRSTAVCGVPSSGATASTSTASTSTTSASTGGAPTGGGPTFETTAGAGATPTAPAGEGCATALEAALRAQRDVASDEGALADAEAALARLLDPSAGTGTSAAGDHAPVDDAALDPASDAGRDLTGGAGSATDGPAVGSTGATSSTTGPAELAEDQSAIDAATASLIEAEQDLAAGTLVSPISGTVAAVGLETGQLVDARSATDAITVISTGTYELTASLSGSQAERVKVGDEASVTLEGMDTAVRGRVTRVGPAEPGSSGTSYPLVVALSGSSESIRSGSAGEATVVVAIARHVLTVPTSAVHTTSAGHSYVIELLQGHQRRQRVVTGVVGGLHTQIRSGLRAGAVVVLADPTLPVPSSTPGTTGGPGATGPAHLRITYAGRPSGA